MSGGILSGGILEQGDFVRGGFVLGGYCPGGYCPRTIYYKPGLTGLVVEHNCAVVYSLLFFECVVIMTKLK